MTSGYAAYRLAGENEMFERFTINLLNELEIDSDMPNTASTVAIGLMLCRRIATASKLIIQALSR